MQDPALTTAILCDSTVYSYEWAVYISGKALMPMLQILYKHAVM